MIRLTLLLCLAVLSSCSNRVPTPGDFIFPVAEITPGTPHLETELINGDEAPIHNVVSDHPAHPPVSPAVHQPTAGNLKLTVLAFDSRTHNLQVIDNENGPGSGARNSKSAAKSKSAIAAINGGFFTPEGKPLGLVYEQGRKYGELSNSSLGAGIYVHGTASRLPAILPRSTWQQLSSPSPAHLLQSGPFLLKNGKTVSGLSITRPRERSFLLWDGNIGWALAHSSSTSLASLSKALAAQPITGFHIHHALNLDGGSSSDLWVSSSVKGGPVSTRHLWNKNVRNYLALVPSKQ